MRFFFALGLALIVACSAPQTLALPSPSATAATEVASATSTPGPATPAPTVNPNPCIAGSDNPACPSETFVDRLAAALEASDYVALRPFITPTGFLGVRNGTGFTGPTPLATPDQVIDGLQRSTPGGKLHVTVVRRPLIPRTAFIPPGDLYVVSTFSQFDNQPQQTVYLVIRSESGTMYWSGALYSAPQAGASGQQTADALAAALQESDFAVIERLVSPNGFNWARSGSGGLATKTPQETVQFLRAESGGSLNVAVQARPLAPSPVPWGAQSIGSAWRNFGNVAEQAIVLVLEQVGERWYWAGGFIVR